MQVYWGVVLGVGHVGKRVPCPEAREVTMGRLERERKGREKGHMIEKRREEGKYLVI